MPYLPTSTAFTRKLEEIHEKLRPYISDEIMRDLNKDIDKFRRDIEILIWEFQINVQTAMYRQVAKLVDEGIKDPNVVEVEKQINED